MQTGWKKLGTNWYYFGESNDGAMRTGFAKVGGDWYYFGGTDDGAMKTGWQKIDGIRSETGAYRQLSYFI